MTLFPRRDKTINTIKMKRNQLGKVGLALWVEFGKKEGFLVKENITGWTES